MKSAREGYKMTELGEIPKDWSIKTINDLIKENIIIDVMDGNHGEIHPKASEYVDIGIPFIMANNLKNGKLDIEGCKFISYEQAKRLRKGFSVEGDVLLTHKGTLGETAIVPKLRDEYIMLTPQVTYYRVSNNNVLINRYLKVYFDSKKYQDKLKSFGSQSTRDYVGITEQRKLSIILPTIEEQEKIASIISTVDEQIDNVDALIEKNKELKKGLMQTLLTKGIGHTKFKKTEIGEIPDEWSIKTIGDVINLIKSGLSRSLKDEDIGIPCIRSNNINNYKLDKSDLKYWFLEDNKGANIKDYILSEGDILVNFINSLAQIGKTCLYEDIGRPVIYTTNIFRMNLNEQIILNKYFYYISQTEMYNNGIKLIAKPAVNQASFTVADFKSIKISVPPINEQIRIVSILSEVDEKIEEHENKKQKLEELKKGLMQQLLTGRIRVI